MNLSWTGRNYHFLGVLVFLVVFFWSCHQKPSPVCNIHETDSLLVTQINRINCSSDTAQSYYVYLPSAYHQKRKWPVVYAFDPHGNGREPVNRMKSGAEKLGFVIIGSNNVENKVQNLAYILNTLFQDSRQKFSIDKNRMYLCGFSGGARVAGQLALQSGQFPAFLCCGAGITMPAGTDRSQEIHFMGIVGNRDFNYLELQQLDQSLTEKGVNYHTLEFDGKHEWPAGSVLSGALLWLRLNAMKTGLLPKNDSLIFCTYQWYADQLNNLSESGELIEAYTLARQIQFYYQGLVKNKKLEHLTEPHMHNKTVAEYQKNRKNLLYQESRLRQHYAAAFQNKSTAWWKNEITGLQQKIDQSNAGLRTQFYHRLLHFISMMSFIHCSDAADTRNPDDLYKFLQIYETADPDNPDMFYFKAKYFAIKGEDSPAKQALETAIRNGFKNISRLRSDADFQGIAGLERIIIKRSSQ